MIPAEFDSVIRAAGADSAGMVIPAGCADGPALLEHIKAKEWRAHLILAGVLRWHFVACGRPWHPDGQGVFALVRSTAELPGAIALCHQRIGDVGSRATAWCVFGEDEFRACAEHALAACAATEGSA